MENINDLLLEAANLLLVGMVVVFLFLSLLIVCIKLMSKYFAGEIEQVKAPRPARQANNSQARSAQITAAITAAVHQHRQKNK